MAAGAGVIAPNPALAVAPKKGYIGRNLQFSYDPFESGAPGDPLFFIT